MLTAVVTILIFLVMISLHEFGHFIFGKLLGFDVLEYAIGFGPAIFKKQGKKTLYSVRIIPFGGYCKFAGEDGENTGSKGDFNLQSCPRRIIVLAAGAAFNILLGFVIFIIFMANVGSVGTNRIANVVENSYLAQVGAEAGDRIIEINGKKVDFYQDIQLYSQSLKKDEEIELMLKKKDGTLNSVHFLPSEQVIKTRYFDDRIEVEETVNGSEPKTQSYEYSEDIEKDSEKIGKETVQTRNLIGFGVDFEDITIKNVFQNSYYMTKFVIKLVYQSVWDMVTGKLGMEQLSGPVGIVSEVNTAVNSGKDSVNYVLNLVGLLTINLGIFNLLPLPALDGGRIIFVFIEMIRRKPVPPEKEGLVHTIGFMLLIILMLFVCYRDILKLFK